MKVELKHSPWIYVLPSLHLCACSVLPIAYFLPRFDHLLIIWVFVMLADLPVSFVAYALAWKYSLIAAVWIFIVGTWWWYFLSKTVEARVQRRQGRHNANGLSQNQRCS